MPWLEEHEGRAEGHLSELALISHSQHQSRRPLQSTAQHGHHHILADQLKTGQYQDVQDGSLELKTMSPQ